MGDMSEAFSALKEYNGMRREKRIELNMSIMEKSGIVYKLIENNTLLIRENGKPKVDFYLSTGRWKVNNKAMKGGAVSLINWYRKQNTII